MLLHEDRPCIDGSGNSARFNFGRQGFETCRVSNRLDGDGTKGLVCWGAECVDGQERLQQHI